MSGFKAKKRFVAGAVCPHCGEQDCLRLWRTESGEQRDCVACGWKDTLTAADGENDATPVRLLNP